VTSGWCLKKKLRSRGGGGGGRGGARFEDCEGPLAHSKLKKKLAVGKERGREEAEAPGGGKSLKHKVRCESKWERRGGLGQGKNGKEGKRETGFLKNR